MSGVARRFTRLSAALSPLDSALFLKVNLYGRCLCAACAVKIHRRKRGENLREFGIWSNRKRREFDQDLQKRSAVFFLAFLYSLSLSLSLSLSAVHICVLTCPRYNVKCVPFRANIDIRANHQSLAPDGYFASSPRLKPLCYIYL